ncbi:MAG: (Fe-S)-binding protein, partial [Paracoccaceae bacterium]
THLATGNIEKARQSATRLVETYAPFAQAGIPIVGLEPSCLFALKDEVPALLKTEAARSVAQSAMTFEELLSKDAAHLRLKPLRAKALLHGHCHQKAYGVMGPVETVLNMIEGLDVSTIETSCCGMAGAFGYGRDTYEVSQKMAEADLLPAVRNATGQTILIADGTSCRSQIKDGAARNAIHVARLLDQQLQDP